MASTSNVVLPKPVTITNNVASGTYDGVSTYASLMSAASFGNTTLAGTDTIGSVTQVASVGGTVVSGVAQAGTFTSTPSAVVLSSGNASNYSFTYVASTSNVIAKADLAITAVESLSGNTYKGSAYVGTYSMNALGSDAASIVVTGMATGTNVGTYTSSLTASGAVLANYNTPIITNANLVVSQAPLGVEIIGAYSGTKNIAPTSYRFTGLMPGETITAITNVAVDSSNVSSNGSNFVTSVTGVSGTAVMSNYYITTSYNAAPATTTSNSVTITPAPLTITAASDGKFVTQTDSGAALANCNSGPCTGGYMGFIFNGFVNGETSANLSSSSPTITRSNSSVNSAGIYQNVLVPSGYSSTNYAITFKNGDYVIAPANALLVRVNPSSTSYGTAPTYTATASYLASDGHTIVTLSPVISGSTVSVNDNVGGVANFNLSMLGVTSSTSLNANVGGYNLAAVNPVITGNNFNNLMVVGTVTIKPLVIQPVDLGISGFTKVYDGNINIAGLQIDTNPTIPQFLGAGALKDQVSVLGSGTFNNNDPNVGFNKPVTISLTLTGVDSKNYVLSDSGYTGNIGTITQLATVSYVGGSGDNWSTASNWAGGAIPTLNNVGTVIIPNGFSVVYDASVVGSIGSAIQNNGAIIFNERSPFTFANSVSGNGVVSQIGAAPLTISGNNGAFTGSLNIGPGSTVLLGSANAIGSGSIVSLGGSLGLVDGTTINHLSVTGPVSLITDMRSIGQQVYAGNVTLASGSADLPMNITSQNSNISFLGTFNSDSNNRSVNIDAGTGTVVFNDTVGYVSPNPAVSKGPDISDLTINAAHILLNADVTTIRTQSYNGAVVISDNGTDGLTRSFLSEDPSVIFGGTLDDSALRSHTLDVRAVSYDPGLIPGVSFIGAVGSITPIAALNVTTEIRSKSDPANSTPAGNIIIEGNISTLGEQNFSTSSVTLQPPLGMTITLSSANSSISFAGLSSAQLVSLISSIIVQNNAQPNRGQYISYSYYGGDKKLNSIIEVNNSSMLRSSFNVLLANTPSHYPVVPEFALAQSVLGNVYVDQTQDSSECSGSSQEKCE